MFKNVTQAYDFTDATLEILIMLLGAFILGWLFCKIFCGCSKSGAVADDGQVDDLTVIEGIGPKIAELLNNGNIYSYKALEGTAVSVLKGILENAGNRFKMHDPSTWPKQAGLAARGKWDELEEYQDFLNGGKDKA